MARESKTSASDVIPLLEQLPVAELDKVIEAAERQRETTRESARRELAEEIRAKAEALGVSLDELLGRSGAGAGPTRKGRGPGKRATSVSPPVKYRNPGTGETWSGRGRMPKWLRAAEDSGRKREEFSA